MIIILCLLLSFAAFCADTDNFETFKVATSIPNQQIEFAVRLPERITPKTRIMVLFGGRNWKGIDTLKRFRFDELAEKHNLILLSPSFKDNNYWEPAKWSGAVLKRAVANLERRYRIPSRKLYFYGYSAGGQCANLFYAWMPNKVAAWAAHGCGVYPQKVIHAKAPALITCGIEDSERFQISRHFIYRYREKKGELLWKPFAGGHELSPDALKIAEAWFSAVLSGINAKEYGEDDTMRIHSNIDIEFRNPLYTPEIRELWLK